MGRVRTIARRTFLFGSLAVAGGVAFGAYMVRKPHANPLQDQLADGAATFNPWVLIDDQTVTLITPHADKGQGVASTQAALIAEELDIEFGQFEISFGSPSPAYWNHGMAADAVPFRSTDESFMAETMRSTMGGMMKVLGMQATGGSTSMPDSFVKLREAGAIARETLKLAASTKSGVPVAQLKTANGAVQLPDGTELKYQELASIAATLDPVQDVTLRDPSQWRMIGKPMKRLDIVAKSTGTMDYGIDLELPGMVYATVCTNPRKGGGLNSFDATEARQMRGVSDVFEITNGVAVVADNSWRAFRAMEAVVFDWAPSPYPAEQEDHWKALEASFTEDNLDREWRNEGDADAALNGGAVFKADYRSPYVAHAPLEPLSAIILVEDQQVTVWTGHQFPRQLQIEVAKVTGVEAEQVILHNQFIGGSFGHRLEFEYIKQAAEIAYRMPGTPVKMTYAREEDFVQDFPRHISMAKGRGAVENGMIKAVDLEIVSPSVIASQTSRIGLSVPGPDTQIAAGAWNSPYAIENFKLRAYRAQELAPTSSWRAVGAPAGGFFLETFIDELIHEAGADPIEERLRLIDNDVARKVLETAAEMSSWGGQLEANQARGVAFVESFGVPVAEVVQVTNTTGGIKLDKVWVACDVGTVVDPDNFENLVQGGVVFGLGHAINCEVTYSDGIAQQSNYHAHEAMRIYQSPEIEVEGLENGSHVRGIGEPPVPPAAPALGNAIFAATGTRLRQMPFWNYVDFV